MADERERQDSAIDADDHHDGACCNACAFSARIASSSAAEPPAPPASGPLRFAIVDGRPVGAIVTLRTAGRAVVEALSVVSVDVRIGRGSDNDVVVRDGKLSRRQATISFDDDGVTVTDARSGCGTFVNGKRVQRARLQIGDRIYLGDTTLEVSGA
jgi:pSer/pThr/pTyr-binding forkhead associated (FHA) protein